MKKTMICLLLALWASNGICGNVVWPDVVDVSPEIITTDTDVLVGYNLDAFPCLAPSSNNQGQTHLAEFDGNDITLTFIALAINPCIPIPIENYHYYNIGKLPAGTYTITFYNTVEVPLPVDQNDPNIPYNQYGEPITFGVVNTSVPMLSFWSLGLLIILIISLTFFSLRKAKLIGLTCLLLCSIQIEAAIYHVLLSSDSEAPTVDQVVAESAISPPPPNPLLQSFLTVPPQEVDPLISQRVSGHFLELINTHPNWSYSRLYRYLVLTYPESIDVNHVSSILSADQYIDQVYLIEGDLSAIPIKHPTGNESNLKLKPLTSFNIKNHLVNSNVISAWELSEGMGYIGAVDVGIQTNHPSFQAFDDNGVYLGGNLLDANYQFDIGEGDANIDSREQTLTSGDENNIDENCDEMDGVDDNLAYPTFVGHGTHMAGLMVAKNGAVDGICKNCGLSMMKFYYHNRCVYINPPIDEYWWIAPNFTGNELAKLVGKIGESISTLTYLGMGVINYSGGIAQAEDYCSNNPLYPICLAIQNANEHNALLVGAAGNNRTTLQLPAADPRVTAVGGLHDNGHFWNESPFNGDYTSNQSFTDCPYPTSNDECGSNKSFPNGNNKTDVVTQARSVYSTFYEGGRHNHLLGDTSCTDDMDGVPNDGYGICTGTSMASPQAASILQLMRSAHPLLPNGDADPNNLVGLRNILNYASSRGQVNNGHDDYFGYGLPDARLALEIILGKSNGTQIKTRLTPMFVNHSSDAKNTAYTPFPQISTAFLISKPHEYLPDTTASLVNEFTDFWYDTNTFDFPAPRANFYVFTTNNHPSVNLKNMVPLRRMEKTIVNTYNRNDTYAVSKDEIENFHAEGYNYAGIEGYIFPICLLEPGCVPFGAHKLYRVEDAVNFNDKFINLPPTDPAPANSTKLGYVYPNVDTDGDGLIDGQEWVLGTSITNTDTDGDGLSDGYEYPPAGVPFSDPLISDIIFKMVLIDIEL